MATSLPSASALSFLIFSFALVLCNPCFCLNFSRCQNDSCGIFSPISYPFGLRNTGCGPPEFQIDCISDTPYLRINGVSYRVLNHSGTSITVVNDGVLTDQACGLPDAPVNLSASPFTVASSYPHNLTLLLGCPLNFLQFEAVNCNSSWLYSLDPIQLAWLLPVVGCYSVIQVPIPQITDPIRQFRSNIEKILRQGFEIEWKIDEMFKKCKYCLATKGICVFNSSAQFICDCNFSFAIPHKYLLVPANLFNSFVCFPYKMADISLFSKHLKLLANPSKDAAATSDAPAAEQGVSSAPGKAKSYTGIIIGLGVATSVISAVCIALFVCCKKDSSPKQKLENSFNDKSTELGTPPIKKGSLLIFSYQELEHATENFNVKRELGDGGFASVYLGKLWDGRLVAVKKLFHDNSKRVQQFSNEVEILSSINHPNLVLLIGYCQYRSELLLVYEYASNGTLADHLHGETKAAKNLVWETRLNIARETAQALAYLHFSIKPPILHRDVKSSNILLDQKFRAKVADFGLSRLVPLEASHVTTGPQGTPGYLDPDYHQCYRLTDKSDVYSFGVVLAELICAKKAVDITRDNRDVGLANLIVSRIQCGALQELVDPNLEIDDKPLVREMVCRVSELAFRCLAAEKDDRPNMMEVAAQLQEIQQFGYGGGCSEKELSSYNSFDSGLETKKLLSHMYVGSPTSVQEKWRSTSTTPDSSDSGFV